MAKCPDSRNQTEWCATHQCYVACGVKCMFVVSVGNGRKRHVMIHSPPVSDKYMGAPVSIADHEDTQRHRDAYAHASACAYPKPHSGDVLIYAALDVLQAPVWTNICNMSGLQKLLTGWILEMGRIIRDTSLKLSLCFLSVRNAPRCDSTNCISSPGKDNARP